MTNKKEEKKDSKSGKIFTNKWSALIVLTVCLLSLVYGGYFFGNQSGVKSQKDKNDKEIFELNSQIISANKKLENKKSELKEIKEGSLIEYDESFHGYSLREVVFGNKDYLIVVKNEFSGRQGYLIKDLVKDYNKIDKDVLDSILNKTLKVGSSDDKEIVEDVITFVRDKRNFNYIREIDYNKFVFDDKVDFLEYYNGFDKSGYDYTQTPEETIAFGGGDCEDLTIFAYFLLKEAGVDVSVVLTDDHALLGVVGDYWGDSFKFDGKRYFLVEVTDPRSDVGDLDEDLNLSGLEVFTLDDSGSLISGKDFEIENYFGGDEDEY